MLLYKHSFSNYIQYSIKKWSRKIFCKHISAESLNPPGSNCHGVSWTPKPVHIEPIPDSPDK